MLIRIQGGRVVDPTAGRDGVGDVWVEDGRVVAPSERTPDRTVDATGCVVMAGGVEVHSHIAGGNVITSRSPPGDQVGRAITRSGVQRIGAIR